MRVVFLDRDGVINRDRADYVKSWEEFEFLPGALDALRRLAQSLHRVVVVTNQSAVNRGITSRETLEDIHQRMVEEITAEGGHIEAVFYCPHRPDEGCACRKPRPGLLLQARERLRIDLADAVLVGDQIRDMRAAQAAGCKEGIFVFNGRDRADLDRVKTLSPFSCHVVESLGEAVDRIIG